MSPNKPRTQKNKTENDKSAPLKKIPQKRTTAGKKQTKSTGIHIDLRIDNRDLAGIVELASRQFTKARETVIPHGLKPMLATLVNEPFTDAQWQFELKLDGYRSIAYVQNGKADLRSRNNNNFNKKFEDVHTALSQWKIKAVVDGEITVLNEEDYLTLAASSFGIRIKLASLYFMYLTCFGWKG
jgi:bifunctional non-homologous end joining protein LigD